MMRVCRECSAIVPEEEPKRFGRRCRLCYNKNQREWRSQNPDRVNRARARWVQKNKDVVKKHTMAWREKNKERYNEYHRVYQNELRKNIIENDKELGPNNN